MPTRNDLLERVKRIIGEDEFDADKRLLKEDQDYLDRIDDALDSYSNDRPREVTEDIRGAGEHDYALPSRWSDDFSVIKFIELPAGNQDPTLKEGEDWEIYKPDEDKYTIDNATASETEVTTSTAGDAFFFKDGDVVEVGDGSNTETNRVATDGIEGTGVIAVAALANNYTSSPYVRRMRVLRFLQETPQTSEIIRLGITARHFIEDTAPTGERDTTSIPTADYPAVSHLVASLAADSIADRMAGEEFQEFREHWEAIAKKHMSIYDRHVGKGDVDVVGADGEVDLDISYAWGSDYLFHPKKWR
jgi:hypothetical protein